MAKHELSAIQREAAEAVMPQLKEGENWNSIHSADAIGRMAVKLGLPEEKRKELRKEAAFFVNASATAQYFASLSKDDKLHRERKASVLSKLDALE